MAYFLCLRAYLVAYLENYARYVGKFLQYHKKSVNLFLHDCLRPTRLLPASATVDMDRLDLSPAPHGRDSSRAYFASSSLPRHEERVLALLSANDEPVVQVVRAGNQVLRREGF